jgi:hypothetical protein
MRSRSFSARRVSMRKYAAQTHPENRTSRPPQPVGTLFQLFALTNAVSSPFPLLLAVTHSLGAATCSALVAPLFSASFTKEIRPCDQHQNEPNAYFASKKKGQRLLTSTRRKKKQGDG